MGNRPAPRVPQQVPEQAIRVINVPVQGALQNRAVPADIAPADEVQKSILQRGLQKFKEASGFVLKAMPSVDEGAQIAAGIALKFAIKLAIQKSLGL